MPTLSITDFSCIKEASFDISAVTVIIGPQGSGKSVTTKLMYFFTDILSNFFQAAERDDSIEDYKLHINKTFSVWFPPSAWGAERFIINYAAGPFSIRLLRRTSKGKLTDVVAVTFSDWFTSIYNEARHAFNKLSSIKSLDIDGDPDVELSFDRLWRVREVILGKIAREMSDEYFMSQTFIPAGRAFFTSIGRLVAGFEQAGSLDPVTIKFARLFADLKDRRTRFSPSRVSRLGSEFVQERGRLMTDLFGGEIKFEADNEYVQTSDGRKVPFSFLSSGQQEILPMWSLIDYFNEVDRLAPPPNSRSRNANIRHEIVYIEEPEAHLFPSAQSKLLEFLISSVSESKTRRRQRKLIITTHSPYIMAKLNVFLKAGMLSKRKKKNQKINEIISRECWLTDTQLSAFAIEGGSMRNLLDEDGLIDGTYLDRISEDISREFSSLLKIESEM